MKMQRPGVLQVSEVQILPIKPRDGLVAFCSCVVNNAIYLGSIAIYTSPSSPIGFRLVFPSKRLPNGKEINVFHPINREAGKVISNAIIGRFEEIISKEVSEDDETFSFDTD